MKIAAQMYSIRKYTEDHSYTASLKELSRIGFAGVEHACGFKEFDGNPGELRKVLDSLGMTMEGTHLKADSIFDPEERKKTADFYAELGAKYLICPGDERFSDCETLPGFIDRMNETAEFLKSYGMFCGYHCHMKEFLINPRTGKTFWDTFAEETLPEVVLEQDCGWSTMASQDAAALIRNDPGRSRALHFKPAVRVSQPEKICIIGRDSVPWGRIIQAAREAGGTDVIVIEQEWYLPGRTDMESIEESFKGLSELM